MTTALLAFTCSALVSFLLTPITGRLARRFGIIDHPSQDLSGHKQHKSPTPYLGGLAIVGGLVAGSAFVLSTEGVPLNQFTIIIAVGIGLGLVGLIDDITPLPRTLRLLAQIAVAVVAWYYGFGVAAAGYPFDLILTVLWIVGITNAFNLLDNIDGACAGLAGIASLTFAAMALINDLPLLPVIAASVAGAALGFLIHNRHPAKVFMGDAGSLFLGFLVALVGLRLRFDNPEETTFLVPVVVLGIPLLDTTLVVISRIRSKRPVFLGARDHVAHRLVHLGFSTKAAVALMYIGAICLGGIGIVISESPRHVAFILLGVVLASGLAFAAILFRVPVGPARTEEELAPATHERPATPARADDSLGSV